MGIGVAFLAAGVFLLMVAARAVLRSRGLRLILGVVVLAGVVAFALSEKSRLGAQSQTIDPGRDSVYVKLRETGRRVPVPQEAVRPARWYESGVEVLVEQGFADRPMTVPQKYVVPIEQP
jgi:hypothetical protein